MTSDANENSTLYEPKHVAFTRRNSEIQQFEHVMLFRVILGDFYVYEITTKNIIVFGELVGRAAMI